MQSSGLFVILAMLVLFWFVLMRPARNQQKRTQELQRSIEVGDEVVLSSGIFGTVRSLDDGRVRLEVSPGVELTVARQAVVRRAEPEPPTDDDPDTSAQQPEASPEGEDPAGDQERN